MRKRSLKYIFDRVYWHLLCLMPFIIYAIYMLSYQFSASSESVISFSNFINSQGLDLISSNIVSSTFNAIFGSSGLVPLFPTGSPVLWYASYVSVLYIIRLCVEFLTFLPMLCHKFYDKLMEM